jgi:hypothetical protein
VSESETQAIAVRGARHGVVDPPDSLLVGRRLVRCRLCMPGGLCGLCGLCMPGGLCGLCVRAAPWASSGPVVPRTEITCVSLSDTQMIL